MADGKTWLISFPRCGNTWIRLFFEKYTKKSTRYAGTNEKPILYVTPETCVWKEHYFRSAHVETNDRVIFLIRNPYDTLASFMKYNIESFDDEPKLRGHLAMYLLNIDGYLNFPGRKLLLYYEDLVNDFETAIIPAVELAGFPVDRDKIKRFIEEDDENHRQIMEWFASIGMTNRISHDRDVDKRRNLFPPSQIKVIDEILTKISDRQMGVLKRYVHN